MQISSTASSVQADAHFRAVCRALVAETLEFSDFLVKVSSGNFSFVLNYSDYFHSKIEIKIKHCISNLIIIFAFDPFIAPENWRELRTKSERNSQELTGLHLADWVRTMIILIFLFLFQLEHLD